MSNTLINHAPLPLRAAISMILRMAIPISLARMIQVIADFGIVALLAQLGTLYLAASSLITAWQTLLIIPLLSMFNAMVIMVDPVQPEYAVSVLRAAWAWCVVLSVPLISLFSYSSEILHYLQQPPEVVYIVSRYLGLYAWSLPFLFALYANQQFAIAMQQPQIALFSAIGYVLLLLGSSRVLVLGTFFLPGLGVKGLAIANIIAASVSFIGLSCYFIYYGYPIFQRHKINYSVFYDLMRKGLGISLYVATEMIAMAVAIFMVGWLGAQALAAQQAAAAYLYVLTTLLIAGSQAVAANVRVAVCQQQLAQAMQLAKTAISLWLGLSVVFILPLLCWPKALLLPFLAAQPDVITILPTAAVLLQLHALGVIVDALRHMSTGALRGLGVVNYPIWVGLSCTCILALGLGYGLGIGLHWGAAGIYIARDIGLAAGAYLLWRRLVAPLRLRATHYGATSCRS